MPRAAICTAVDAPIEVADLELDAPHAGEVRVRLGASGVCHSDLSVQNGTLAMPARWSRVTRVRGSSRRSARASTT